MLSEMTVPLAVPSTPADVHLEQPVLRMDVALHQVKVVIVAGAHVSDAVDIARDLRRGLQAGDSQWFAPVIVRAGGVAGHKCARGQRQHDSAHQRSSAPIGLAIR